MTRRNGWAAAPQGSKIGTATVREDQSIQGFAQKRLAEKFGTKPESEFDEIADGVAPGVKKVAVTPREAAKKALQALGRLPTGTMNGTESRYAAHLDERKRLGEIAWYQFEGIKLRLARATFLTVDFAVMLSTGELEMHDAKGARAIFEDDAKAKMKIAADKYPFAFFVAFPDKKNGGWEVEQI